MCHPASISVFMTPAVCSMRSFSSSSPIAMPAVSAEMVTDAGDAIQDGVTAAEDAGRDAITDISEAMSDAARDMRDAMR